MVIVDHGAPACRRLCSRCGSGRLRRQKLTLTLKDKTMAFCRGCFACHELGRCAIQDDAIVPLLYAIVNIIRRLRIVERTQIVKPEPPAKPAALIDKNRYILIRENTSLRKSPA